MCGRLRGNRNRSGWYLSLKLNSGIVRETRIQEKGHGSSKIYRNRVELNESPIQDPGRNLIEESD